jgi:hypothetical protein
MSMSFLQTEYGKLQAMEFPPHAEADELEDILMELLDLDRCIAGHAQSVLSGKKPDPKEIPSAATFSGIVEGVIAKTHEERLILEAIRGYVSQLCAVERAIRSL